MNETFNGKRHRDKAGVRPNCRAAQIWNSISLISEPFSPRQKSGDSGVCRDKLPFRGCLER